jgi:uncharacterized RDD family membrane protein YckC
VTGPWPVRASGGAAADPRPVPRTALAPATDDANHAGSGLRYADFAPRLGALLLGGAILAPPFLAADHWGVVRYPHFHLYATVATNVVCFALTVWMVGRFGGSPGKLILGLRVTDVSGGPAGYRRAALPVLPAAVLGAISLVGLDATLSLMPNGHEVPSVFGDYMHQLARHQSPWAQVARWLSVTFFVADFVVLYRSAQDRALHDQIAGTAVIRRREIPLPAWLADLASALSGLKR